MVKLYLSKNLLNLLLAIRQLSPSMLLLSLTLHGLVLLIPFSLSPRRKIIYSKTTSAQEQIFISQSAESGFFTDNKALVKQKDLTSTPIPTNDPQFTSQLPSLPKDATLETQLPIPEIRATPAASFSSNARADLTKEMQQATDGTAAVVIASVVTPTSPKKQNPAREIPVNPNKTSATPQPVPTPKPVAKAPPKISPSPKASPTSPTQEEKETFDNVFGLLNSELSLSKEENSSQSGNISIVGIQNTYGTVLDKTPEYVAENVNSKLEAQGFKVSQQSNYASGLLYVVKKNKFTEYVTFTPNVERTGTIITTWSKSPVEANTEQ